jgi:hypothetical protein
MAKRVTEDNAQLSMPLLREEEVYQRVYLHLFISVQYCSSSHQVQEFQDVDGKLSDSEGSKGLRTMCMPRNQANILVMTLGFFLLFTAFNTTQAPLPQISTTTAHLSSYSEN